MKALTFKNSSENDVPAIELGARTRPGSDQELNIPVIRIELDLVLVVVLPEAEGKSPGPRMRQQKSPRIDGLDVPIQISRRPDLALVPAALAAGGEVLALEDLVDDGSSVAGGDGGGGGAHCLEVGDGAGEEAAVEAEDDPTEGLGVGAGRGGGGGVAEGAVGEEGGGAEAEVDEDAVGDGGVRRRRGRRRRRKRGRGSLVIWEGWSCGEEEEEAAAREEKGKNSRVLRVLELVGRRSRRGEGEMGWFGRRRERGLGQRELGEEGGSEK